MVFDGFPKQQVKFDHKHVIAKEYFRICYNILHIYINWYNVDSEPINSHSGHKDMEMGKWEYENEFADWHGNRSYLYRIMKMLSSINIKW